MKKPFAARSLVLCAGSVLAMTLALSATSASAQQNAAAHDMPMSGAMAGMPSMAAAKEGAKQSASDGESGSQSTAAFKAADTSMMQKMSAPPYTGNADQDFVAHMIPHHDGAVAMAQIELKYGKDPELRRLAKNIIRAQKQEMGFMQRWQRAHPVK